MISADWLGSFDGIAHLMYSHSEQQWSGSAAAGRRVIGPLAVA